MKGVVQTGERKNRAATNVPAEAIYRLALSIRILFAAVFLFLFVPSIFGATPPETKSPVSAPGKPSGSSRVAPLPASEKPIMSHAPYDAGDCSICHSSGDAQNPGPIKMAVNELCLGCHEDYKDVLARKYGHAAVKESCVNCHNPHNSKQPKLLIEEKTGKLCFGCHKEIEALTQGNVKHDALAGGCTKCHNPHGANVEHLLIQLPMQLCLQCHSSDNVLDHDGKKLTNMKKLLADNPKHHGPVAAEDCSACHNPHGSQNFRLLAVAYPATFYSPYDSSLYGLCFGCHEEKAFTTPETEELTQFRNRSENLHYVHVHKSEGGRTCRACHEVHACAQDHQIRDGVPFGPKGWTLKLHYTKTPTGGQCERTCHRTQTYNNSASASETEVDEESE